jgi:hypothetical protein
VALYVVGQLKLVLAQALVPQIILSLGWPVATMNLSPN